MAVEHRFFFPVNLYLKCARRWQVGNRAPRFLSSEEGTSSPSFSSSFPGFNLLLSFYFHESDLPFPFFKDFNSFLNLQYNLRAVFSLGLSPPDQHCGGIPQRVLQESGVFQPHNAWVARRPCGVCACVFPLVAEEPSVPGTTTVPFALCSLRDIGIASGFSCTCIGLL